MEFLKLLESIRCPFLDTFFSTVTHLGEETVFIVVGILFFWCINKKEGYFLLSVGLIGTVINQFLKLWFRIPRPWVKDPDFTIVESARAEATGYSFPSGHTQSSVGIFAGIGRWNAKLIVRILCIAACVLVPLSRLYLGVHTPLDVGVSLVIALVLVFGFYPIVKKCIEKPFGMRILLGVMTALSIAFLLFVNLYKFPADIDMHNFESGVKNAYKMLGCIVGLWLSFEVDLKFTKFDTDAKWWAQILKFVLGLIPVLLIKIFLKDPCYALCGGSFAGDGIRYFLITAFAGCVWPLTFKWFGKLGK
ncbi:MAG: phosphatase PAP2 family protein [Clostridia bacterium]|nr:phosphatase PAP2 family protein [Clostridia bacterium]